MTETVQENALAKVDAAKNYLAQARDITDILKIHDMAIAAHAWATAKGAQEAAALAIEVKLRAERKGGEFLRERKAAGTFGSGRKHDTLSSFQLTPKESERWQQMAKIPEARFERVLVDSRKRTQKAVLQVAKELEQELNPPSITSVSIPKDLKIRIENLDFTEAEVRHNSVDMILTDPPYADLELWKWLGERADWWLKEGGVLAAYCGQTYLRESLTALSRHLNYVWTLSIIFGGNTDRMHQIGAHVGWKPILLFCKGKWKIREFNDTLNGPRSDKRFHEWGQPWEEFRVLLDNFTQPGDTVLDPMVGGGSVIEACIHAKRHCIAFEKDPSTFDKLERFHHGNDHS